MLLTKNSLRSVQDQLSERAAEISHHVQVGQRLEAELQMLKEKLSRTGAELEQKRCLCVGWEWWAPRWARSPSEHTLPV